MKTVQRETLKPEVKPAETPVPAAEMKTVQRETALPEARPADTPAAPAEMKTVQRETVLPEVRPAEKPVPTAEMKTVQRETVLPEAKPVDTPAAPTEMTTVQREIKLPEAKPAKSSRRSAAGSQLPLTDNLRAEVQREAAIPEAKPVKGSQPSAVSGHKKESEFQPQAAQEKSIQREMSPEQRAEFPAPSVSDKTVQRKMSPEQGAGGGSLSDLLKGLPTHYEMPKEQIEAIRSGRPYTGHSDAGKEPPTVSRELSDGIGKMSDPENRPEAGARNSGAGRAAAEAVVQNIIQREPDFVLPKHTNGPVSENQTSEPEVRREILSQPAASHSFSQTAGKLPGAGKTLPGSFGQKGLPGSTGAAPLNNGFFGGVTGLIQRESEDNGSPAPSPSEKASADQETGSDEAAEEKIHALFPEVTATQLDTLADKLVPRIKRMMRAEMERSVFR